MSAAARLLALALLLTPAVASAQVGPPRIGFSTEDLREHRIAGNTDDDGSWGFDIAVVVDISPEGDVTAARDYPLYNQRVRDLAPYFAIARKLKFRPFTYRGRTVAATGIVRVSLPQPGKWLNPGARFPAIDYATLRISLIRSACYWVCPDYNVTIAGDGGVTFSTEGPSAPGIAKFFRDLQGPFDGVLAPGTHRTRIDRAAVDALIARFRAVHFFGLRPRYNGSVTDQATQMLVFETGGHRFELFDYAGTADGMPPAVDDLERAVDEAAGTARWVSGDATTLAMLRAEGFDPRSAAARAMALDSLSRGDGQVALDLIDAGLDLDAMVDGPEAKGKMPLGEALLLGAVSDGRARLFARLADAGWLDRASRARLEPLFVRRAGGCDPAMIRRLVAAGIDVNARLTDPQRGSLDTAGMTALGFAVRAWGMCEDGARPPAIAALLALGADPNIVDAEGETALFKTERIELIEALLAGGARADVVNKKGLSPAFNNWSDAVALRLLEAGASPEGKDADGFTLRQIAGFSNMPATQAWLDAHGVK